MVSLDIRESAAERRVRERMEELARRRARQYRELLAQGMNEETAAETVDVGIVAIRQRYMVKEAE